MTDASDIDWYSDAAATFGDRVAAAREAQGLAQKTLAKRLGVAVKTIESWEHDLSEPRANKLQMLSGVLNVSIPWLLTGAGEGLSAPSDLPPAGVADILSEMRGLRMQTIQTAERIGHLEKRLRSLFTEGEA